jgi:heme oxygenase (biliverdin-IX-beta and delta-forming)
MLMREAPPTVGEQDLFIRNLRQETGKNHQKLEENPLSKSILEPSVSLSDYQKYLSAMYGVTVACEQQVFPALTQLLPDLADRHKADLVVADLKATGFSEADIQKIPVYHFIFSSVAEAMGIMYVLEGSTLGGRVLYKHVNQALGLTPETGAAYFWGYGQQTGALWKSFMSALSDFAVGHNEREAIIESAKKTFSLIDHWLAGSNSNQNEH